MAQDPGVDAAYSLKTPEDSRRLYGTWAATYDSEFAATQDYRLPALVAEAFHAGGGVGPVLDVGAGTGLCGGRLAQLGIGPIDGIDISPQMLDRARAKGTYRDLTIGDVTGRLDIAPGLYSGVVSSGTFTLGHIGPEAINELIRIAAPGALFVLSINSAHYRKAGFGSYLDGLGPRIADLALPEVRIYGSSADIAHHADTALLATFRTI